MDDRHEIEPDDEPDDEPGLVALAWGLYRHVAAIFGAFAIAAFLTNIFDLDWRGVLETAFGYWNDYVRPVMAWVFHVLVTVPLSWLGLKFEVPLAVRDYLSVGVIIAGSFIREVKRSAWLGRGLRDVIMFDTVDLEGNVFWIPLIPFVWPVTVLVLISELRHVRKEIFFARSPLITSRSVLFALSPFVYLALLFGLNYFLS